MKKSLSAKQIIKRFETYKSERNTWESHWQELADYILPEKNNIQISDNPGQKKNTQVLDATGMDCAETLAGTLHTLLTNPNDEWFEMTTGDSEVDKQDEVRLWMQDSTTRMHNAMNNSNFQTEVHEIYLNLVCFGTAGLSTEEDEIMDMVFASRPIQEIFLEEDSRGRISEVYRSFQWTAEQCAQEFGVDKLSKTLKKAYDKDERTKFDIIHAIYPGDEKGDGKAAQFAIVSQYVAVVDKEILREKGYHEKPLMTPRWIKVSGEKYGRSPGMKALPEIKTLNVMTATTIKGAQKVVDPPLQAPDDGFVLGVITKPAGINYYRAGSTDRIEPLYNNTRIDFGFQVLEMKQKAIKSAFYTDQLKLQQGGPMMTATEVLQRTEEAMRLLGPMLGRMQSEFLRPLIDRVFGIMLRRNRFKPIPVQLRGRKLDVHYSSLIAKSQRMAKGQNILRTIQAAEPFINADPTVMDNFNGDRTARYVGTIYGFPQECLNTAEEMKTTREARGKAQQQAVQQQQQAAQADTVSKVLPAAAQMQAAQRK